MHALTASLRCLLWLPLALPLALTLGCEEPVVGDLVPIEGRPDMLAWHYRVSVGQGISQSIPFEVPEDTVSLLIEARTQGGTIYPAKFLMPDSGDGCDSESTRVDLVREESFPFRFSNDAVPGHANWLFPNASGQVNRTHIPAGCYKLAVRLEDAYDQPVDGYVDISIYMKQASGFEVPACGFEVEFVFDRGAIGRTDKQAAMVGGILEQVNAVYAPHGVQVQLRADRYITEVPVPADAFDEENAQAALNKVSGLASLLAYNKNVKPDTLRIFLLRTIGRLGENHGDTLGYSLGLPGPVEMQTKPNAAVLISLRSQYSASEIRPDVGRTVAHEIGHFMGLYHTAERDGRVDDPLRDTPSNGSSNLMDTEGPRGTKLTTEQAGVVRRHPLCDPARALGAGEDQDRCSVECSLGKLCVTDNKTALCAQGCDPYHGDDPPCPGATECVRTDDGIYACLDP